MNKRFIILLALLLATGAAAQPKTYFCTKKGTTLRYERFNPDSTKHWWTNTSRIEDVQKQPDGSYNVVATARIKSHKVKAPVKDKVSSTAVVYPDGTVEINISDAVSIAAKQHLSILDFKPEGGVSSMKSTIKPGDKLEEIHGGVDWAGIKYSLDYTDRTVVRRETITVPAGTFDCVVIKEHKVEKAPLFKRDRITLTWYSFDVGLVRHDTFLPDGRQECTEQLYAIEK